MELIQLAIIIVVAIVCGLGTIAITLWLKFPIAWVRKITHVVGGSAYIIVCAMIFNYKLMIPAGIIFAVLVFLMRLHPPKQLAQQETLYSYGESLLFVGIALTALIADSTLHFVIPIAILGLADTAAYVVGRSIKSPKLIPPKSLAGSTAFAIVAFFLLLIVAPWWLAIIGAILTSVAELIGFRGSDNITIPVVAVILLTFI
jgi:phytol kinase